MMDWVPDDHTNAQDEAAPADGAAGGSAPSEDRAAGGGAAPEVDAAGGAAPEVVAGGPPDHAGSRPDPSTAALLAGLIALVTGPLLTADPTLRYLVLAAAVTALVLGAIGVWMALRGPGRLDYAAAALVTGGVSLYLWIGYVSDPPQGGT